MFISMFFSSSIHSTKRFCFMKLIQTLARGVFRGVKYVFFLNEVDLDSRGAFFVHVCMWVNGAGQVDNSVSYFFRCCRFSKFGEVPS
jgi:hypothetical protein